MTVPVFLKIIGQVNHVATDMFDSHGCKGVIYNKMDERDQFLCITLLYPYYSKYIIYYGTPETKQT